MRGELIGQLKSNVCQVINCLSLAAFDNFLCSNSQPRKSSFFKSIVKLLERGAQKCILFQFSCAFFSLYQLQPVGGDLKKIWHTFRLEIFCVHDTVSDYALRLCSCSTMSPDRFVVFDSGNSSTGIYQMSEKTKQPQFSGKHFESQGLLRALLFLIGIICHDRPRILYR